MNKLILIAVFLFTTVLVNAQTINDQIELLKSDLKNNRKAVITETMKFTESESKIFWPIYREYEVELEKLMDRRIATIKEFAQNYDSLSNEQADQLMKASFAFLEDRLSLNKKYYNKYAKELSPTIAAKYMQLENEIQLIIDTQIASTMPYFKKIEMKKK